MKVKHAELPVDQPPAVAFTAFADVWPRATETEIGAALCAIGAGRTFTFDCLYKLKTMYYEKAEFLTLSFDLYLVFSPAF